MALTHSKPFTIGKEAPDFTLHDVVSGKYRSLKDLVGKQGTLIFFICNHCPYVKWINKELVLLAKDLEMKGIKSIAISSNDVEKYPEDHPRLMKEYALKLGYPFPYLYDESQDVAKAYDAACTPDFYLLDKNQKVVYHGQLDDSRPNSEIPVTGKNIRKAVEHLLANKEPLANQTASIGCGIKWKNN